MGVPQKGQMLDLRIHPHGFFSFLSVVLNEITSDKKLFARSYKDTKLLFGFFFENQQ